LSETNLLSESNERMTIQEFQPTISIRMTEPALRHARKQLEARTGARGLRLGIKASGCSGYKYVLDWVSEPSDDDQEFAIGEGVSVFVDTKSLPFVNGTEIDFVKEGLNSMFKFNNPNVDSECGCGESFSVAR